MASTFQMHGVTGEPLTSTATATETSPNVVDLPSWAKNLLSKPSISVRRGIAWGFEEPFEESCVLVLTTPTGLYVDIRFAKTKMSDSSSSSIHWAFAGTSEMKIQPGALTTSHEGESIDAVSVPGFPCMAHGKWNHEVDSDRSFSSTDEGDIFLLANGDSIEIGEMTNPRTRKTEMYKEYWTSPTPAPRTLEPCIDARTNSIETKGFIIRIGDYLQAILQSGPVLLVERWTRMSDQPDAWMKDSRSNTRDEDADIDLPSLWVADDKRQLGDHTNSNGRTWKIIELHAHAQQ